MNDLTLREKVVSASLVIAIVWLGLFPQPVLNMAKPALLKTLNKQKEITFRNPVNKTGDRFINAASSDLRGYTPQPPQGGAEAQPLSMTYHELLSIVPPNIGLTMGYELKSPHGQRINPPLGGLGGRNSRLMDFKN